ncbi:hypothetical protein GCM10022384_10270 [Streptomyces marokkonensis]|uniref:DUF2934 domain-containing protein n=1 Tax=Streptomyces marokkonensis TaxID=324855 RepID=A0ABP7P429_9ACTN
MPAGRVPPAPQVPDPPIYRELMRTWADRGRTLPGRHDPEWIRLAAPERGLEGFRTTGDFRATAQAGATGDLSVPRDPRGDGR